MFFFSVLCLNINIQIAKHIYPNIPPDVFNITSSTSHEPSFDISWISSTVTEHSIHINVTLNNTAVEKDININKKMIKKERIALDAAEFLLDV